MLKAYSVYEGRPADGCLLIFAPNDHVARRTAQNAGLYEFPEYICMTAKRMPYYDQFAKGDKPYVIETNEDLPREAEPYYDDEC